MKWYVISMQTATTNLICLRQVEPAVLFSPIFYFKVCYLCLDLGYNYMMRFIAPILLY